MASSVGMSMGSTGIRAVRTVDGQTSGAEWFPSAGAVPDAEDVAHAIRVIVDRPDAPSSLGVAFPDPDYSAALKAALVEEYVSEVHIISEIAGTIEALQADPQFRYRTVAFYDLGATGLQMTVADVESGTVYATTRSPELSGDVVDRLVMDNLLSLDILAVPRNLDEEKALLAYSREIKEALSTHEATQTSDGQFQLLDRRMFDLQIIWPTERSAIALRDLAEMSEIPPEVVVPIGGGARIPLVRDVLRRYMHVPVVVPEDPELVSARGAALYATRVDSARPATPTAARRSAKTLLTPLLRFGLPSIAAVGVLSWLLWPEAGSVDRSVAGTPVTTIADTAGSSPSSATSRSSSAESTSTQPTTTEPPPPPTTTDAPEPPPAPALYVAPRNTGRYVPPPPLPPPPPPFQLPRIELPQIQLPQIQLPFP